MPWCLFGAVFQSHLTSTSAQAMRFTGYNHPHHAIAFSPPSPRPSPPHRNIKYKHYEHLRELRFERETARCLRPRHSSQDVAHDLDNQRPMRFPPLRCSIQMDHGCFIWERKHKGLTQGLSCG
ncbi:hypothetical protein BC567DRAFT_237908 [Phyllosticta citribraziliensis]